jgi:AraC-like DNA-binding protein/CheY-like chemotaxis protein
MKHNECHEMPRVHHIVHGDQRHTNVIAEADLTSLKATMLIFEPNKKSPLATFDRHLPGCRIIWKTCQEEIVDTFLKTPVDAVLLTHSRQYSMLELLSRLKTIKPSVPIIILAETGSESLAIDFFRRGARDYFRKPLQLNELALTLQVIIHIRQASLGQMPQTEISSLEKGLQYIQRHYKNPLALQKVADQAGMSLSSFVRRFKKKTGMTFVDYVNNLRISLARSLLSSTSMTLMQISITCGYNSQSHFNRIFKKNEGISPGQYRKQLNKTP